MDKLMINLEENVIFYEIEENDTFDYEKLRESDKKELDDYNEGKMKEITENLLRDVVENICRCSQGEIIKREMQTSRLLTNNTHPNQIRLRQEDIDQYKFVLIITTKDGRYESVDTIIRECKKCHEITYKGSAEVFGHLVVEATANMKTHIARQKAQEEDQQEVIDDPLADPNLKYETIEDATDTNTVEETKEEE